MLSERVRRILIAKGAPFTGEEMDCMSDSEGWAWIYENFPPENAPKLPEMCFTGFDLSRKAELQKIAEDCGFKCVTKVTKNLKFLCTGKNAGPSKIKEANKQGVQIISEQDFISKYSKSGLQ
jgi:NAD-dependent DNA ligase